MTAMDDDGEPLRTVPAGEHLARVRTGMQTIDLERRADDGEIALYLDGFIQFVTGQDDVEYHGTLATKPANMLGRGPIRALVLGGGDGLVARNLLRMPNVVGVVMVEIDRGMLEFCSTNPIVRRLNEDAFRNPRLKVKVGDARKFVAARPKAQFDLAIVDFPDPTPELLDLYRAPFYASLLKHMNPQRHVISVQASGDTSPVWHYIGANMERGTGVPIQCITFPGKHMDNGIILLSKRGC